MKSDSFLFCGHEWSPCMEGGRIIHPDMPWMWYAEPEHVNEGLMLSARNSCMEVHHWDGNTYHPTVSASTMMSVDSFGYGTFSAEIRLPRGRNLWPSFWLTGAESWPPEIDIVEAWTNKTGGYLSLSDPHFPWVHPNWRVTHNIHWKRTDGSHGYLGSRRIPLIRLTKDPSRHFVTYECVWNPYELTFKADGRVIRSYGRDYADKIAGSRFRAVFNLWTTGSDFTLERPMAIKNFSHMAL